MIPKIIHFCWFGQQPYPSIVQDCIQSWSRILPYYEIIKWDENNSVLDCSFAQDAYQAKNWAFVSDYIRLKALYDHGGIYLDTDMMMIRPLDKLLNNDCFLGFENENTVSAGVIGAISKHYFTKECMNYYVKCTYDEFNLLTIPQVLTKVFANSNRNKVQIYPVEYFYSLPYYEPPECYIDYVNENTYAVHLWSYSWANEFSLFWKGEYTNGLKKVFARILKNPLQPFIYYKNLAYHFFRFLKVTVNNKI